MVTETSLDEWLTRTNGTPTQVGRKFKATGSGLKGASKTESYKPTIEIKENAKVGIGSSEEEKKEIWQIPKEQWCLNQEGYEPVGIFLHCSPSQYGSMSKRGQKQYDDEQHRQVDLNGSIRKKHQDTVLKAYFEGKTIPEEVLKDYWRTIEETKKQMAFNKEQDRIRNLPRVKSINEFTGQKLKKELGLMRAGKGYENKHTNKSGNFGYTLVSKSDKWYTLHGDYDSEEKIVNLHIAKYGDEGHSVEIPRDKTYDETISVIKKFMEGN